MRIDEKVARAHDARTKRQPCGNGLQNWEGKPSHKAKERLEVSISVFSPAHLACRLCSNLGHAQS